MLKNILVLALAVGSSVLALAPLKTAEVGTTAVPDGYIIVLKKEAAVNSHVSSIRAIADEHNNQVSASAAGATKNVINHVWESAVRGYAGRFSAEVLAKIRANPDVAYVEQDAKVSIINTQTGAPWGLGRVSSRNKVSNPATYFYDGNAGAGVKIFVVDTGIRTTHTDFGGRAVWGANFAGDGQNSDGHGHGTHVSGTSAGSKYGVAKKANLVAVKVLDAQGSGTNSGVISGINWVASEHKAGRGGAKGSVINMSLGGSKSTTVNAAASAAVKAGVHVAVAAGNSAADACTFSPASATGVLTVAASDVNDKFATFSNYGTCVEVIAPGVNVLSAWNTNDSATNTISGTSMASPHSAGILAYYASLSSTSYTPAALIAKVTSTATPNKITNILGSGTPNLLVYNSPPSS
ncbi:subtilisin-like protein [Ramicandelaber brevisporus]|nr:subtilisin-like protein [Ramicandelaber brevisporus]